MLLKRVINRISSPRFELNTRRVTSQDVANLARVSRTTVSLVLNNVEGFKIRRDTRQRVLQAARELGYVPDAAAQALASRRARIIGLILTRLPHHISTDAFITQILEGLFDIIHQNDMRLLIDIIEPKHQHEAYLQLVRANRIDGILLSGPRLDDDALQVLETENFPTVLIGQLPHTTFCSVDVDNLAAAQMAVAHLVKLGHQRIAFISNAHFSYSAALDRKEGYRAALLAAGIQYDERLVRSGDFTVESGFMQMTSLLDGDLKFSAVFVASDIVALGAKAAILRYGYKIPQDIALVGFDDLPFVQYIEPAFTTVHLPTTELARRATELLIKLLEGEQPPSDHILLDTNLVIRDSCGASQNGNESKYKEAKHKKK